MRGVFVMKKIFVIGLILITVLACFGVAAPSLFNGQATMLLPKSGELYSVSVFSTINGLMDCLKGEAGTGIIRKGDSVVFIWRFGLGYAFTGFNATTATYKELMKTLWDTRANLGNETDVNNIVKSWIDQGWKYIPLSSVPINIVNALATASSKVMMSKGFTTFVFLPVGTNPGDFGAIKFEKISNPNQ
jgi:hypothetical protein